jgi:hypothetical protein
VTHPAVRDLFHALSRHPAFQELTSRLLRRETGAFSLSGLTPVGKALYLALLWQATERPMLVLAGTDQRAEQLAELAETFFELLVSRPEAGRRNEVLFSTVITSLSSATLEPAAPPQV